MLRFGKGKIWRGKFFRPMRPQGASVGKRSLLLKELRWKELRWKELRSEKDSAWEKEGKLRSERAPLAFFKVKARRQGVVPTETLLRFVSGGTTKLRFDSCRRNI
jgi:hypothetical protein